MYCDMSMLIFVEVMVIFRSFTYCFFYSRVYKKNTHVAVYTSLVFVCKISRLRQLSPRCWTCLAVTATADLPSAAGCRGTTTSFCHKTIDGEWGGES